MFDLVIMGEMLVEIMRDKEGVDFEDKGTFLGPFPSGAPAICISAAARLGAKTAMIGAVGDDGFGKNITKRLKEQGVDISCVAVTPKVATGVAFVTYFDDGSRKYIFHMGNSAATCVDIPEKEAFDSVRYFHMMGCSLMCDKEFAEKMIKTMHLMKAKGAKISFDPNIRQELFTDDSFSLVIKEVMDNVSILMPGAEELISLTGTKDIDSAISKAFENPNLELIALKEGSKGSLLITRDKREQVGAYKVEQKDATGAGDCYDGAFLAALSKGLSIKEAAKWGAAAGALNAAAFGPMEGDISPQTVSDMINRG